MCSENCESVPEGSRNNRWQNNWKNTEEVGSQEPPYFCFFHCVPINRPPARQKVAPRYWSTTGQRFSPSHYTGQSSELSLEVKVIIWGQKNVTCLKANPKPTDTAARRCESRARCWALPPSRQAGCPPAPHRHPSRHRAPFLTEATDSAPAAPGLGCSSPLPLQPGDSGGAASWQASLGGNCPRPWGVGVGYGCWAASYRSVVAAAALPARRHPVT